MKLSILSRRLHRWGAIAVGLPFLVVIASGLLLQVKKQVPWVQPKEQRTTVSVPGLSWERILAAAQAVPEAGVTTWTDIDRLDVRPSKGLVKVITTSRWELQLALEDGRVLQTAYRRSDLIEQLHDGSFFGDPAKLWIFLPSGIVVFGLWLTGLYLFVLPMLTKRKRARLSGTAALLLLPVGLVAQQPAATASEWSLLISGGTVVDGTGGPRYAADVAIAGDRVVLVSRTPLDRSRATRVIDARGLIVAPGFIDLHAHLDPLLAMPDAKSAVTQGVTLALGGPDGTSPFPLAAYLDSAQRAGLGINVAFLVGHNTVRRMVMGTENRAPTPDELARMVALIRQGMGDGAIGISTGLRYVPGFYSKTDEVVALSRAAADSGGIYTSHLREEGLGLLEGVAEAITIARDARIPVVLTHHKAVGALMWGKTVVTLAMVDSARAAGLDVMLDQYPYTASQTSLSVLIPPWALAGGRNALRARLEQPALRDSIERGIVELLRTDRGGGDTRRVQFGSVSWDRTLEGKTLHDWAERRGVGPSLEAAAKLVLEGELNGGASMVYHIIDEGDVRRVMQHPQTMIASDGRLTRPGQGVPHPRAYGTFPRVLGHYVREEGVISLETAVHKMTGMPAKRLGLAGQRGCLAQGCAADVAIFDAATVGSPATFENPHQYAVGIPYVIVNGVPVVDAGTFTDARPGRALRRPHHE